jgi:hypothetical protein
VGLDAAANGISGRQRPAGCRSSLSPVTATFFIVTIGLLAIFTTGVSWRRGLSFREIASVTLGYALVMVAVAVIDSDADYGGALVLLAALGGGMVQYGVDAHRASRG